MKSQTSDLNENSTNGKPGLDDQQDSDWFCYNEYYEYMIAAQNLNN